MTNLQPEVVVIPVSDVDRAKRFYEKLGFRMDIDYVANETYRVIQFTPPGSATSIIFGKGITSTTRGSTDSLVLAADDINAARAERFGERASQGGDRSRRTRKAHRTAGPKLARLVHQLHGRRAGRHAMSTVSDGLFSCCFLSELNRDR